MKNSTATTIGTGSTTVAKPIARKAGGKFVKQSKAQRIRNYVAKGLTTNEIIKVLKKAGLEVRYSQVHRYVQAAQEVATA